MLSNIDHPNIINILEMWEWDNFVFLVMDYCYGGDLFQYVLERNSLEEDEVKIIMK